jgi:hypothetical protein
MLVALGSCALLGGSYGMARAWRQLAAPAARLDTTELDLGNGVPGQLMKGTLQLFNDGWRELRFSVAGSCACTVLEPKEGCVVPGEAASIQVGLRLARYSQTSERVRVTVTTDDPDEPVFECSVVASCPVPLLLSPERLTFECIAGEQPSGGEQRIAVRPNRGSWGGHLSLLSVIAESTHIEVTTREHSAAEIELVARLRDTPEVQDSYERIALRHPDFPGALHVPVHIRRVDAVRVVPSVVFLPASTQRESDFTQQLLAWREGGLISSIEAVALPEGVSVRAGPKAERFYPLSLTCSREFCLAGAEGHVRLRIDGDHDVDVRLVPAHTP